MSLDQEKYAGIELKEASVSNKRKQREKKRLGVVCEFVQEEKKLD